MVSVIAQYPFSGWVGSGAEQLRMPTGHAGRFRIPARRQRGGTAHIPPHPRRRQVALRIETDQPQCNAVTLRRQAKATRGGEIERARVARDLPDDKSHIAAAYPLFQRKQGIFRPVCQNMNDPVANIGRQSGPVGPAIGAGGGAVLHPQDRPVIIAFCQRLAATFCPPLVERERQRRCYARPFIGGSKDFRMAIATKPRPPAPRTPPRQRDTSTDERRRYLFCKA